MCFFIYLGIWCFWNNYIISTYWYLFYCYSIKRYWFCLWNWWWFFIVILLQLMKSFCYYTKFCSLSEHFGLGLQDISVAATKFILLLSHILVNYQIYIGSLTWILTKNTTGNIYSLLLKTIHSFSDILLVHQLYCNLQFFHKYLFLL